MERDAGFTGANDLSRWHFVGHIFSKSCHRHRRCSPSPDTVRIDRLIALLCFRGRVFDTTQENSPGPDTARIDRLKALSSFEVWWCTPVLSWWSVALVNSVNDRDLSLLKLSSMIHIRLLLRGTLCLTQGRLRQYFSRMSASAGIILSEISANVRQRRNHLAQMSEMSASTGIN